MDGPSTIRVSSSKCTLDSYFDCIKQPKGVYKGKVNHYLCVDGLVLGFPQLKKKRIILRVAISVRSSDTQLCALV